MRAALLRRFSPVRLLPVDERFFTLLGDIAERMPKAAGLLAQLLASPANMRELIGAIKDVEHSADVYVHDLMERLAATFVTPFESEDIAALAYHLDNVTDLIDGTARRVHTFGVVKADSHASQLSALIVETTMRLASGVAHLHEPRRVLQDVAAMLPLETQAELAHREAVARLFDPTIKTDVIEIIKWNEMFDRLEETVAECFRAANTLERIALKHA